MEKMMERMTVSDRQVENQIRNPNFRGQEQQQPQLRIKQREQRGQDQQAQQQIRTPLQQNYAEAVEEEEEILEENHLFDNDGQPIFLTEDAE
jgi:transcriptional antiterminator